jgi:hypothetical protein
MNPRPEDVEALARAIDRVVFHETAGGGERDVPASSLTLVSYLNDSFPRLSLVGGRRDRLQRRLIRALRLPAATPDAAWGRLEAEMNRRLSHLDPRWTPVVGGAALVLLGVLGVAVWRQRGGVKPAVASMR